MLKSYLKLAFKVLGRRKFYTAVSILCVAFTIMILVFVTAVMQTSLHSKGAERNSDRYLIVDSIILKNIVNDDTRMQIHGYLGYAFINRYLLSMNTPQKISYFSTAEEVVGYKDGARIESMMKQTDANFWQVFVFNFIEGRPFNQAEHDTGRPVIVINEKTRQRYFGTGEALGEKLTFRKVTYEVIGVVENVGYPEELVSADAWAPVFATNASEFKNEESGQFMAVLMGNSPRDLPAIREEFDTIVDNYKPSSPVMNQGTAYIRTNDEFVARRLLRLADLDDEDIEAYDIQSVLTALLIGGFLFMVLPAINLINLNISRILERAPEIGVRKSFGAPSTTLIGQFVVENIVLTLVGGAVGFALAWLIIYLLANTGIFPVAFGALNVDLNVFFVSVGTMLFFAVLSGIYPAWKMSRLDPIKALRGAVS